MAHDERDDDDELDALERGRKAESAAHDRAAELIHDARVLADQIVQGARNTAQQMKDEIATQRDALGQLQRDTARAQAELDRLNAERSNPQ